MPKPNKAKAREKTSAALKSMKASPFGSPVLRLSAADAEKARRKVFITAGPKPKPNQAAAREEMSAALRSKRPPFVGPSNTMTQMMDLMKGLAGAGTREQGFPGKRPSEVGTLGAAPMVMSVLSAAARAAGVKPRPDQMPFRNAPKGSGLPGEKEMYNSPMGYVPGTSMYDLLLKINKKNRKKRT